MKKLLFTILLIGGVAGGYLMCYYNVFRIIGEFFVSKF